MAGRGLKGEDEKEGRLARVRGEAAALKASLGEQAQTPPVTTTHRAQNAPVRSSGAVQATRGWSRVSPELRLPLALVVVGLIVATLAPWGLVQSDIAITMRGADTGDTVRGDFLTWWWGMHLSHPMHPVGLDAESQLQSYFAPNLETSIWLVLVQTGVFVAAAALGLVAVAVWFAMGGDSRRAALMMLLGTGLWMATAAMHVVFLFTDLEPGDSVFMHVGLFVALAVALPATWGWWRVRQEVANADLPIAGYA